MANLGTIFSCSPRNVKNYLKGFFHFNCTERARDRVASPGGHATQREKSGIKLNDHMSRMKTNRCRNVTHHTWHWHIMSLYDLFIEDFERQHWKIEQTVKTRLGSKRSNLITEYLLDFFLSHIVVGKISSIILTRSFYI